MKSLGELRLASLIVTLSLGCLVIGTACREARATGLYRLQDLGSGRVVGINNKGDYVMNVAGESFFHSGGTVTRIGSGEAIGLNDLGQVIGYDQNSGYGKNGYVWQAGQTTTLDFSPTLINNKGEIIGAKAEMIGQLQAYTPQLYRNGVTASLYDVMDWSYLGLPPGPGQVNRNLIFLNDFNSNGQIVGSFIDEYASGQLAITGFLGGSVGPALYAPGAEYRQNIVAITEDGAWVANDQSGYTDSSGNRIFGFVDLNGLTAALNHQDYLELTVVDMNRNIDILAFSDTGFPNSKSKIWLLDEFYEMYDPFVSQFIWKNLEDYLTTDSPPGWSPQFPVAINNLKQIVGTGYVAGKYGSWLLSPEGLTSPPVVPEPGAVFLAMSAAPAALHWLRRRRRDAISQS